MVWLLVFDVEKSSGTNHAQEKLSLLWMNNMLFLGLARSAGTTESSQVGKGQFGIGQ
jgi:hypothetical protein